MIAQRLGERYRVRRSARPATTGKAIKLTVNNLDTTPEEFESKALAIEKVVAGKGSVVVRIKPLAKGTYSFVGEYHEDTAKGVLLAE